MNQQKVGNDWKCHISLCQKAVFVRSTPVFVKTSSLETLETIQKDSKSRFGTVFLLFFSGPLIYQDLFGGASQLSTLEVFSKKSPNRQQVAARPVYAPIFSEDSVVPLKPMWPQSLLHWPTQTLASRFDKDPQGFLKAWEITMNLTWEVGWNMAGASNFRTLTSFGTTSLNMGWSLGWPALAPFSKEQNCSSCWEGIIYLWVGHHCTDVKLLVWLLAHFFQSPIQDRNTNSKPFLQQHALNSQTNI